jgi:TPR repeat protein
VEASQGPATEGGGFAYGAASLQEALEEAAAQAIEGFRRVGGTRIQTVKFEAGVSAKPDYALAQRNGTWTNSSALSFAVGCHYPSFEGEAQRLNCRPQFPQEAKELARWLLAPEQKNREYAERKSFGVYLDGSHRPRADLPLPVFLTGIQDAAYRSDSSLSPAERQQRDETGKLALELFARSRTVPAALESALKLLLEAAKLGHVEAQRQLGYHHASRALGSKARMEGLAWLGAAASQGDITAKRTLIEALLAPDNPDPDRALAEMVSLAERGYLSQFNLLAWVYREGQLGLPRNPAKAVEYLQRGISFRGPNDDEAGYRNWLKDFLAVACFRGEGISKDLAAAALLLRESGMEGQSQATPGDIYRAYFYATGEHGFTRDFERAQQLLKRFYPGDWPAHEEQLKAVRAIVAAAGAANSGKT